MIKLEVLKEGTEEQQVMEVAEFLLQHNQIIYYPIIFLEGWKNKKIKVFTKRDNGKITGIFIASLFTCPITTNTIFFTNYRAGEDISQQVNETLELCDGENRDT